MKVPEPDAAVRDAVCHWSSLPEVAGFAARRHGFGNSDGGFGVTCPGDLDEYDRVVDNVRIPDGFVQVHGFRGLPDGYGLLVPEAMYLDQLANALSATGQATAVAQVRSLVEVIA